MTGADTDAGGRRGGLVPGLLLVAVGAGWLLETTGAVDLDAEVWIGLLLVAVGLGIALDARRSHGLLVALGVVLVILGIPVAAIDVDVVSGGVGDVVESPSTEAELEPRYEHGVGKLTIDLTSVGLPQRVAVEASLGIGDLLVLVPADAAVDVDAQAGIGDVVVLGAQESGIGAEVDVTAPGTSDRRVQVEADVGIGKLVVARR